MAEAALLVGEALHATLPSTAVEVSHGIHTGTGVLFHAERDRDRFPEAAQITVDRGPIRLLVDFPSARVAHIYGALVETGAELLALARGRAMDPPPQKVGEIPPLPDPPTTPKIEPLSTLSSA